MATVLEEFLEAAAAFRLRMVSTPEMMCFGGLLLDDGIESPSVKDLASSGLDDLRQEEVMHIIERIEEELGGKFTGRRSIGLLAARRESKRIVTNAIGAYEGATRLAAIANDVPETFSELSAFVALASDWALPEFRDDVERDIVRAAEALLDHYKFNDLVQVSRSEGRAATNE